jgi:hypothetical protein
MVFPHPAMTLAVVVRLVHYATIFEINVERIKLTGLKMTTARIRLICSLFFGPIIFRSTEHMADRFRLPGLVAEKFMVATGRIGFVPTAP